MNNYDSWKAGGYETERNEKLYTEEQILFEQLEVLQTRYDEKVKLILHLQKQIKRLSELEMMLKTFNSLSYEEQKEKLLILSLYETI